MPLQNENATQYATRTARGIARLLDTLVLSPVLALQLLLFIYAPAWFVGFGLYLSLVPVMYMVILNLRFGQTLGKRWMGIQIRSASGETLGMAAAWIRELPAFVYAVLGWVAGLYLLGRIKQLHLPQAGLEEILSLPQPWVPGLDIASSGLRWFAYLSVLSILLDTKRRALHDFLAGTVVVVTEAPKDEPAAASRPA